MRRWLKRIVIVLAVFVPLLSAFYFYAQWQGERELRAVIAELDAQDEPWRWDDLLAARPTGPEDEHVRALLNRVSAATANKWTSRNIVKINTTNPPNMYFPPEVADIVAKEFKALEETIDDARTILSLRSGRYIVRHNARVFQPSADDPFEANRLVEVLQLAAMWHAHQGDLDKAIEDCEAIQHASQILRDEPELRAQLSRLGMRAVGLNTLERVMAQGTARPDELKQMQGTLEKSGIESAMILGMRGERAFAHRIYEALAAGEITLAQFRGPLAASSSLRDTAAEMRLRWNLK